MGQEIDKKVFTEDEIDAFKAKLKEETKLLLSWAIREEFSHKAASCGLELEAWLVDDNMMPVGKNEELIEGLGSPMVVPELSSFNIEFNADPEMLDNKALSLIHSSLDEHWASACAYAKTIGVNIVMIGTLPTIDKHDLTIPPSVV